MSKRRSTIIETRSADDEFGVTTVVTTGANTLSHRKQPCAECPWRKDAPVGAFPAEAYRISAGTAYDMADRTFSCHMSGSQKPAVCAGFLLRGADHNLQIRMAMISKGYRPSSVTSDVPLYDGYREMAIANGVDPDDPVLAPCRS